MLTVLRLEHFDRQLSIWKCTSNLRIILKSKATTVDRKRDEKKHIDSDIEKHWQASSNGATHTRFAFAPQEKQQQRKTRRKSRGKKNKRRTYKMDSVQQRIK